MVSNLKLHSTARLFFSGPHPFPHGPLRESVLSGYSNEVANAMLAYSFFVVFRMLPDLALQLCQEDEEDEETWRYLASLEHDMPGT